MIIGGYELARAATESLFLGAYGSEALPWVWIAVALTAAVVVSVYGRLAGQRPLIRVLGGAATISAVIIAGLAVALDRQVPHAPFVLYVVKDVYVVVLVEIFWSNANAVFDVKRARWTYGLFCASGSLGGAAGGLVAGWLAERSGTASLLIWLVGCLGALAIACFLAPIPTATAAGRSRDPQARPATSAFAVVAKSRYLTLMIALVASVQIAITLVDYAFNAAVQQAYPSTDARTVVIGQVYSAINAGAVVFQLLTGPILRLAGIPHTLLAIPLVLATTLGGGILAPAFLWLAAAKVLGKVLDYSLFRAAKEILYIPLAYAEKTRGKAVVDMFGYRAAKGGASLLLLGLVAIAQTPLVPYVALGMVVVWLGLARALGERFRRGAGS